MKVQEGRARGSWEGFGAGVKGWEAGREIRQEARRRGGEEGGERSETRAAPVDGDRMHDWGAEW